MTTPSPPSPDVREYVSLQLRLQDLFQAGQGDGEQADSIRDQMDGPWYRMTREEQDRMRGLSADLNALLDGGPPLRRMSAADRAAYQTALQRGRESHLAGDHDTALAVLRGPHPADGPPPGAILQSQGASWAEAGFPEVSVAILKAAERLNPSLVVVTLGHLRALARDDEALRYAERILSDPVLSADPLGVLMASATIGARARELPPAAARPQFERLWQPARDALELVNRIPAYEAENPGLTACLERLLQLLATELGQEGTRFPEVVPIPQKESSEAVWAALLGQAA